MPRIQLFLFGPFQLTVDDRPATAFHSDKVRALLAYLALADGKPIRRAHLAALLWDGYAPKSALQSLRMALSDLRKQLAPLEILSTTKQTVELDTTSADFWCDALHFRHLLTMCQRLDFDPMNLLVHKALREASALDQGELLNGLTTDSAPFTKWQRQIRNEHKDQVAQAYHVRQFVNQGFPRAARLGLTPHPPLLERTPELKAAQVFLRSLPTYGRGLLQIVGEAGLGRSRFLAEVRAVAKAEGYAVLDLSGTPALSRRIYGVLTELHLDGIGHPHPVEDPTQIIEALYQWSATHPGQGMLLTVDDPQFIDEASLHFLQRELLTVQIPLLALIYTIQPGLVPLPPFQAPLNERLVIKPLSPEAMQTLLIQSLQAEPPADFLAWFYTQTQGFPAAVQPGLTYLIEQGYLRLVASAWVWLPPEPAFVLAERLGQPTTQGLFNLPALSTAFVGRVKELRALKSQIRHHRLITVLGLGGAGKTRLALQTAAESAAAFPDGIYFVSLVGISQPRDVLPTIADALNVHLPGRADPVQALIDHLRHQQILLVLDNFEEVRDGAAFLTQIHEQAAHVCLLVTSRERLNLPAEAVFELTGLPVPDDVATDPARYSAVQLFVLCAQRKQPTFHLTAENEAAVIEICRQLSGMPLGIELAAARLESFSPKEVSASIRTNLAFLQTEHPEVLARHRSLSAIIESVWAHFSEAEKTVLRKLSVFHGGFSRCAAQEIAGASSFFLDGLLAKAYLTQTAGGRLQIHQPLHQYAWECLQTFPGEEDEIQRRHGAFYIAFVQKREEDLKNDIGAQIEIKAEINNIREAWRWAVERGEIEYLARGFTGLDTYFWITGAHQEGYETFAHAIARLGDQTDLGADPNHSAARLADNLILLQARHGMKLTKHDEAIALTNRVIDHSAIIQDLSIEFRAYALLGTLAHAQGRYAAASAAYARGLALAQTLAIPELQIQSLSNLGLIQSRIGHHQKAIATFNMADPLLPLLKNLSLRGSFLHNFGSLYYAVGHLSEADRCHQAALDLFEEIGDRRGIGLTLSNLGMISDMMGDYDRSKTLYDRARQVFHGIKDRHYESVIVANLARRAVYQAQYESARSFAQEGIRLAQESTYTALLLEVFTTLGQALIGLGQLAQAKRAFDQAVVCQKEVGMDALTVVPQHGLAQYYLTQGDLAQAGALVGQILAGMESAVFETNIDPYAIYWTCYQILTASRDSQAALVLATAHTKLMAQADGIPDPYLRQMFLEQVPAHRLILAEVHRLV